MVCGIVGALVFKYFAHLDLLHFLIQECRSINFSLVYSSNLLLTSVEFKSAAALSFKYFILFTILLNSRVQQY